MKLHAMCVSCHWSNLVHKVGVCIAHSISGGFIASGQCQDRPDCLYRCMKKYQKIACTSLPEDEPLVVQNMPKTIQLN